MNIYLLCFGLWAHSSLRLASRAKEGLGREREQEWQEESSHEGVDVCHESLEFVAGPRALLLIVLFLFHHLEVKDTWNEHLEKWADNGGDHDPEVGQDIVGLAVQEREEHHHEVEKAAIQVSPDRLSRSGLISASIVRIDAAFGTEATPCFLASE